MQKKNWLRYGFAAVLAGSTATSFLVACSGDDDVKPVINNPDTGTTPDTGTLPDSGGGGDADAAGPVLPKLILVHAANEAGPVRLCLARSETNANPDPKTDTLPVVPPLPYKNATGLGSETNIVAIPPGIGSVLPLATLDITTINIKAIVIKPGALIRVGAAGNAKTCSELMAAAAYGPGAVGTATALAENTDFFVLPTIPKGTFKTGETYVGLVTGCPAGLGLDTLGIAKCGPGYSDTTSNLRVLGYKLDKTTQGGAGNVVQFIHGSSHVDAVLPSGNNSVKPFITLSPDAGADGGDRQFLDNTGVTFATTSATSTVVPTPGAKTTGAIAFTSSQFGVTTAGPTIAGGVATWQTLGAAGVTDATFYKPGRGYTFIAVGDPQGVVDPATGDFRGVHFLAFDNDPVVPKL